MQWSTDGANRQVANVSVDQRIKLNVVYLSLSVGWVACQLLHWPVLPAALGWGSLGVGSDSGSDTWMKLFLLDSVLLGRLVLRLLGYSSAAIFDLSSSPSQCMLAGCLSLSPSGSLGGRTNINYRHLFRIDFKEILILSQRYFSIFRFYVKLSSEVRCPNTRCFGAFCSSRMATGRLGTANPQPLVWVMNTLTIATAMSHYI